MHLKKFIPFVEHLPSTLVMLFLVNFYNDFNLLISFYCLFFGWLIDIDHIFDYVNYLRKTKKKYNLNDFISGIYFSKSKKIFLILHSYEITFVLLLLSIYQSIFIFVAIAHFLHLLQDQIFNNNTKLSFFFVYRYLNQFDIEAVCRK